MNTRELLSSYWSLDALQASLVKDAYSPKSLFEKLDRSTLTFTLARPGEEDIDVTNLDDLILQMVSILEPNDWCRVLVYNNDHFLGYAVIVGYSRGYRSEEEDELFDVEEYGEDYAVEGLSACINERWRMQRKGDSE
jgi:hypothetical protein